MQSITMLAHPLGCLASATLTSHLDPCMHGRSAKDGLDGLHIDTNREDPKGYVVVIVLQSSRCGIDFQNSGTRRQEMAGVVVGVEA